MILIDWRYEKVAFKKLTQKKTEGNYIQYRVIAYNEKE